MQPLPSGLGTSSAVGSLGGGVENLPTLKLSSLTRDDMRIQVNYTILTCFEILLFIFQVFRGFVSVDCVL
jgi:hypothetical protein